jgi:hypothetical protein
MANADTLQIAACASRLACLTKRDLLIFIAQTLAAGSGLSATQLLNNSQTSGIRQLNPRQVLVVITEKINQGAGLFPDPFAGLQNGWISYSYSLPDNTIIGGPGLEWIDFQNGNNAVTGSGSIEYRTAGISGAYPSLQVSGDTLNITPITLAGDFTIVIVAETSSDSCWLGHSALNQQIRMDTLGANQASMFPATAPGLLSDLFSTTFGNVVAVTYRRSGTTSSIRENKTARGSNVSSGTFVLDRIGASPGAGVGGAGDLGAILVFNVFKTDTQLDRLYDTVLKPDFGLP